MNRTTLRSAAILATFTLSTLLAQACGGVSFTRNDGAPKYKPLRMKVAEVKVVDSVSQLGAQAQVIGTIAVTKKITDAGAEKDKVIKTFAAVAKKRGCDALSDLASSVTEGQSVKREKVKGPQGKVTYKKVTTNVKQVRWTAVCVRTAKAKGGLKTWKGAGSPTMVAKKAEPAPAPAPEPAKPAPAPAKTETKPGGNATPPPPNSGGGPTTAPAPPGPPTTTTSAPPVTPPPPTPPTPAMPKLTTEAKALWKKLGALQKVYLPDLKGKFGSDPDTTLVAVQALGKVMKTVAGKRGFWRETVPTKWFGCGSNPNSDACGKLRNATRKLDRFTLMINAIANLSDLSASMWLDSNNDAVTEFLRDITPKTLDLTGMKETPFFKQHFAL